ncbi:hypothetical protein Taro_030900 [Colocasia esculenta]|uniref:Protein kinase domain-containing protein n=1 Tax=Colocasia esculenta TaxID=4460 RepID=A0A843W4R8_COLES|nr:hypothetical protein [Colocasia esculenta]
MEPAGAAGLQRRREGSGGGGGRAYPVEARSYRLLHEIGSGVSAVVYKAVCLPLDSTVVAIKSIDLERSRANLDDVRREAKAMALLSHPNVLTAHCSFTVGSRLWVVMPFMAAGSLQSIISAAFPDGLAEPSIAVILRETLQALLYLHGQGHIHRDIKAGNILVDSNGSVKLADFGVSASIYESQHSSSSSSAGAGYPHSSSCFSEMAGTPYWMAPEVIHSHVGYGMKADIWSFGITALELAHGRPPLSHLPLSKSLLMRVTHRLRLDVDAAHDFGGGGVLKQRNGSGGGKKKKKFSKAFKEMVAACLSQDPAKRPSADKLLRHTFFKGCKSPDYLVKNVLQAVPSVEERFKGRRRPVLEEEEYEGVTPGDDDDGLDYVLCSGKSRRISGWNFNEDVFQLDPVYPADAAEEQLARCKAGEYAPPPRPLSNMVINEALVPNLVSLLSSLDMQRGMVMDVLACCAAGAGRDARDQEAVKEQREEQLAVLVRCLEQTVEELNSQLHREMARNAELEEALDGCRGT